MSYILCDCSKGGICRNFKNIINSMRYSDYYNAKLIIYWPRKLLCMDKNDTYNKKKININNIKFEDILNINNFEYILVVDQKELLNYDIKYSMCGWQVEVLPNENISDKFSELNYYLQNKYKSITYEFDNINSEIKNNLINYYSKIEFNSKLIEKSSEIIDIEKKIIGVTIRSWPEHFERKKYFNIENYFEVIDKNIKNYSYIFVCSDDKEQIIKMKDRYGDKIITNGDFNKERGGTYYLNVDDIIDLISLSKCDLLVGNLTSNWTEFIWFITKCKIDYITINEIPNDNMHAKIKKGKLSKYNFIT